MAINILKNIIHKKKQPRIHRLKYKVSFKDIVCKFGFYKYVVCNSIKQN